MKKSAQDMKLQAARNLSLTTQAALTELLLWFVIFSLTPCKNEVFEKDVTEGNQVAGIVDRMAISHPEISFRFIRDGKQVLITSGNGDLKSTVYSVLGKEMSDKFNER